MTIVLLAVPAAGDVLVTKEGERIGTRGPWTVKGRQVVFTSVSGTLSALRLDEIDLDASTAATEKAAAPPPPPAPPTPQPRRPPVLTITDADVAHSAPAVGGPANALIGRLRTALRFRDADAAMATVHVEGTTAAVRQSMRDVFVKIMQRPLRTIEFQAVEGEVPGRALHDGVTYAPNAPVVGRLLVIMEPTIDDGDADATEASFFVGEHLGNYVLVAPEVVPNVAEPEGEASIGGDTAPTDEAPRARPEGGLDRPGGGVDPVGGGGVPRR